LVILTPGILLITSIDQLAETNLNGREIKNRVRLAYSMAAGQKDRKITMKIINSILNIKRTATEA
jgi:hypothetical protein